MFIDGPYFKCSTFKNETKKIMTKNPTLILLFSGKRKSGKDYLTNRLLYLLKSCEDKVTVIKITAPIKQHFAKTHNLNFDELMGSGTYKETVRKEMIEWSEQERHQDPGIFCKLAIDMYHAKDSPVWVVSDVRRKTDIAWFKNEFGSSVRTIRIEADESTRRDRGYVFTDGVDNVASECDLDDFDSWDWKFNNSGDESEVKVFLDQLVHLIKHSI